MPNLLHPEYIARVPIVGEYLCNTLAQRVGEVAMATEGLVDPAVSVVIRSRNNAGQLAELLDDIEKQDFNGEVEVVVVDTESTDGTAEVARNFGAVVVPIEQKGFNYPDALNQGFAAASHRWVFSLVDHSLLTSDQIFRIATRSQNQSNVAGVSGITFPNANASRAERIGTAMAFPNKVRKPAHVATKLSMGILATNTSLIRRDVWSEVGGFDEAYGAGGEDGALAAAIDRAGYDIVIDPAMSVHHTHGTGFIDSIRQFRYWGSLGKPQAFDQMRLEQFRKEFRPPEA